jgi:peptidoglycan/LPS O-acetylase OafA/YrhL
MYGAFGFGFLIGWYVYYVNRYRRGEVQLSDIVTLVGILGGGAVLIIFPAKSDLFGAYGIGLAAGYFLYFLVLIALVRRSPNFTSDWFLDGRRKRPVEPFYIPDEPDQRPMSDSNGAVQR